MTRGMTRRRWLASTLLAGISTLSLARESGSDRDMIIALRRFVADLDSDQQRRLSLPFDDPWRRSWHYIPRRRPGLSLGELSVGQRGQLWQVLEALLSRQGMAKAQGVIELEQILGELTGRPSYRDPDLYHLVLFGEPAAEQPWGWRFEGHHLSLSATLIPGQETIVTPAFLGANPATVPQQHERAGLRVLAAEADLAFDLVNALPPEQQRAALIGSDSLGDIVSGPGRESRLQQPEGTALAALSDAHREQASRLLAAYLDNMEQALAAAAWSKLRAAGLERVRFAWAGSLEPGRPHYYRLHGPTLLIEYDNTQNRANHAHSVWHDLEAGGDPLRAHYHQAPHGHGHG